MTTVAQEDLRELIQLIRDRAVVEGPIVTTDNERRERWVNLHAITMHGPSAALVGRVMLSMAHHLNLEVVAGESAAGDAIAQAMMHVSTSLGDPLDACLVHREEIAPGLRIVGPAVSGRRVALVVGLRVTGPNVSRTIEILREAGAEVVAVIALVDNGTRMHLVAREAGLPYRGAIGLEQLGVADLA